VLALPDHIEKKAGKAKASRVVAGEGGSGGSEGGEGPKRLVLRRPCAKELGL